MGVIGDITAGMSDLDQVAKAAVHAAKDHLAVRNAPERRAGARRVVDAVMRTHHLEDRVVACGAVLRAHAAVLQRSHEIFLFEGSTVGAKVVPDAVFFFEVHGRVLARRTVKLRCENTTGAHVDFFALIF